MPTDVDLFNMLDVGVLEKMTQIELLKESERARNMHDAVAKYWQTISEVFEKEIMK